MSALSRDYSATLSANRIINRRMDLTWFIVAALSGYALVFMHAGLGWGMVAIWFLWVVFLDSPHLFGTFSRTYLDKREFQPRRKLDRRTGKSEQAREDLTTATTMYREMDMQFWPEQAERELKKLE